MKGADDMRVLACRRKRLLSFTWNAPPHLPDARAQRTVVVLRFEPVDEKRTTVRLTHVGWGDGGQWDQAYQYFDRAWGNVLAGCRIASSTDPRTGRIGSPGCGFPGRGGPQEGRQMTV
jgi:uncharacterized protein YndB with AHSA1/START domain